MISAKPSSDIALGKSWYPRSSVIHGLLIILICLLCYSNTFHASFQFDDEINIIENPFVRDISSYFDPGKIEMFSADHAFRNRTFGYFTFAVNYRIHGNDVVGYHIFNIVVHSINGLLVYFLVLLTFKTPFLKSEKSEDDSQFTIHDPRIAALFTALLFVCHPVQTQAITYIVQRLASLATLFYLLSLVMYIKSRLASRQAGKLTGYALSLLSAVLAMKTKEIAFTLPLIIVLYELLFFDGPFKKRILYLVPLLLTMLIIPVSLIGATKPLGEIIGDVSASTKVETDISRWGYLFTEFRVIVTYIRLLFLPVRQNVDYDYPVYDSFFMPPVFLSFLFLVSIFGAAVYLLHASRRPKPSTAAYPLPLTPYSLLFTPYSRLLAFGIFWFFITLSVESSIIPIVDVIFEHRVYLPSVGFFIALMAVLSLVLELVKKKARWTGKIFTGVLFSVLIALSAATYARNTVWQSELSLWNDVLRKSPAKARAHNNLGLAFMIQGDAGKAADAYARAIALDPNMAEPHYNLGRTYERKKQYDRAIEEYKKAVDLKPDFADAFFDLGLAYASKGLQDEAISHYKSALRLRPRFARAHFNLGISYLEKNLPQEARDEFEAALQIDPSLHQAREFLEYINGLRQ